MKKALVVGINKYPTAPLYGRVNDATALHAAFKLNSDGSCNFDSSLALDVPSKGEWSAPFMYHAAMNPTGYKITVLSQHYWRLAAKGHL